MSSLKAFLRTHLEGNVSHLEQIGKGCFSEAYSFIHNNIQKIIRLNSSDDDFQKDLQIYEMVNSESIPVPKIEEIGPYPGGRFFCISYRCPGQTFDKLSLQKQKAALPSLINTLAAIHQVNNLGTTGFGLIDRQGRGKFETWAEQLLNLENHKIDYNFPKLYKRPYFDLILFNQLRDQLGDLIEGLSITRTLVHGDFGFGNLIIDQEQVTGVIDWAEARFGDPLYDYAWLDYWSEEICFMREAGKQNALNYMSLEGAPERFLACSLHIGLGAMLFAAHFDEEANYHDAVERLSRALKRRIRLF